MDENTIIKIEASLCFIGAIGLLIWWFSMPVFLTITDASDNFQNLILNNNWIPINTIGLISTLLVTLGFPGFYLKNHEKFNQVGFWGLIISMIGLIFFTIIRYYETLIWPAAAKINPELLQVKGDLGIVSGLFFSGAFLGIGYTLFGISALKTNSFPTIPLWLIKHAGG